MSQQALPGLRQPDAPGRSGEKRGADPLFETADRLTYRGGCHAEPPRGSAKAAQLSDDEKHDQAVQMRPLD